MFNILASGGEGAAAPAAAAEGPKAWQTDEQKRLEQALKTFPATATDRWDKISEAVPTRTKKECMKRYKVGNELLLLHSMLFFIPPLLFLFLFLLLLFLLDVYQMFLLFHVSSLTPSWLFLIFMLLYSSSGSLFSYLLHLPLSPPFFPLPLLLSLFCSRFSCLMCFLKFDCNILLSVQETFF